MYLLFFIDKVLRVKKYFLIDFRSLFRAANSRLFFSSCATSLSSTSLSPTSRESSSQPCWHAATRTKRTPASWPKKWTGNSSTISSRDPTEKRISLNWFCPVETGFRWLQPEKSRNSQSRLLNSYGRKKKNFKLSCLHYIKYDYNFRLVKSFIGLLQRHNGLRKYQILRP